MKLVILTVLAVLGAETVNVIPAFQVTTFMGRLALMCAEKESMEIILITNARTALTAKPAQLRMVLANVLVAIREAIYNQLATLVKQLAPLVFSETVLIDCAQLVIIHAKSVSARERIIVSAARLQLIFMK